MEHEIQFFNKTIHIVSEGKGTPLVLLHGYLESLHIWDDFAEKLSSFCKVIRIDLPGHGKSATIAPVHSMELMAESVITVLDALEINKCLLVGHSMGGYVTLAVAETYMDRLSGFCLFHSTPFADTDEKKENRNREIELVRQGKKDLIIQVNIPKGFAGDNAAILHAGIERAKNIANETPEEGIIAALEGMKDRKDRSGILRKSKIPFLWILGEKDNYINFQVIKEKIDMNHCGRLSIFRNSGHMGFIEEEERAVKEMISCIASCTNP
jgi:pimeloyl-ACP methyl ester carboxylesterase